MRKLWSSALFNNDRLIGCIFLAFSVAYVTLSTSIPLDFWSEEEPFNARSMPQIIGACGIVTSLMLIFLPSAPFQWTALKNLRYGRAIALLSAIYLYGSIIELAGFVLATVAFLIGGFLMMGEKRWRLMLMVAIGLAGGFWLIMDLLGIYLAPGEWWEAY